MKIYTGRPIVSEKNKIVPMCDKVYRELTASFENDEYVDQKYIA